jgi:hypothetical protein
MNSNTDSVDFVVKVLRTAAYTPSTLTITGELKNFGYRVSDNPTGED